MNNQPPIEELKSHPVFGTLEQMNLDRLAQVARIEQFRRHDVICGLGERSERIALVLDGSVKITAIAPNQREVILDILGPGDIVGEEAVTEDRSSYNATILRDSRLLLFPASAIRTLLGKSSEFAMAWVRQSNLNKQRMQQRVTELAYGNIEDRLFRLLSHLVRQHGTRTTKGNSVLGFPLTHQELANFIGATRETTTVAIGRLKTSGVIALKDRKIIVKDKLRSDVQQDEKAG